MAREELPGAITRVIQRIQKPDSLHIQVYSLPRINPELIVIENGDTRALAISHKVAEVLIADGFPYSS